MAEKIEKTFHSITLPGQDTARVPLTAAEFSPSTPYTVRDYCTYRGVLYRCTTAHAAGVWNDEHFTPTNVDAEFDRKLDIPFCQASEPDPKIVRDGDLWIDTDENSPVYNVDASPTLGSTNAVQSGGTKVALNSLDSRKMEHGVITGDFSASVDYRIGDLVFYATTANGITTRTLYRCTKDHDSAIDKSTEEAWDNGKDFTPTTLEVELQKVRDSEANTDMIGDLFGAKSIYAVGDYCVYNDFLYRCIQAVNNTGVTTPVFNPNDWTQVALANDVNDLKGSLPVIDHTLTVPGQAADAMRTGLIVARSYSSTDTYKIGDFVNHNGLIYKCIKAILNPEEWTQQHQTEHWVNTNLGPEITEINNNNILNLYTSSIYNQIVTTQVDLSTAETILDKKIVRNGRIIDAPGYNIISFNTKGDKSYYIRTQNGSGYTNQRMVELIQNNSVIGYKYADTNLYQYIKIHDFIGTVRVCYRALNQASFQCYYCIQPYEQLIFDNQDGIKDCNNKINSIFSSGKNLYNKDNITNNKFVSWNNGNETSSEAYVITDFIPIESGQYYSISWPNQTCIYNENKEYIGGFYIVTRNAQTTVYASDNFPTQSDWLISYTTWDDPITILAQPGWAYIRQTVSKSIYNGFMIENSQIPTAYEPFYFTKKDLALDSLNLLNMNKILSDRTFSKIIQNPVNIKLIGDSITAGVGGTGYNATSTGGGEKIINQIYTNVLGYCWANLLKEYWESKFNCTVNNYGWSGIASQSIITYWNNLIKETDDIIICTIGTNDRADCANITEFINKLEKIYLKAIQSSKQIVFIANIPASIANETNGTKNFHMEDVEHAIRYVTDKYNIPFVNLYKLFMDYCTYTGTTIDSYLSDGLHPNDAGYNVMFNLITNAFNISPKRPDANW